MKPPEVARVILTPAQTLATASLFDWLAQAFGKAPSTIEQERKCYELALLGVAHFIKDMTGNKEHATKLVELASALSDLGAGTVRPLLLPVQTKTRPPDGSDIWRVRANVALAIVALVHAGEPRKVAADWAARKFPDLKKLANETRRTRGLSDSIVCWYDSFRRGKVKNVEAANIFNDDSIQDLARLTVSIDEARSVASHLLGKATENARRIFPPI